MKLFFKKQKKSVIISLIFFCFIVTVLISIYSYNPYDRSWVYSSTKTEAIKNFLGAFGAQLSATLYFFLGSGFFIWLSGLLLLYKWHWQRRYHPFLIERVIAVVFFMINFQLMMQLPLSQARGYQGGHIGYLLYVYLKKYVPHFVLTVVTFSLSAACIVIIMHHHAIRLVRICSFSIRNIYHFLIMYKVFERTGRTFQIIGKIALKPFALWIDIMRAWYDGSLFQGDSADVIDEIIDSKPIFFTNEIAPSIEEKTIYENEFRLSRKDALKNDEHSIKHSLMETNEPKSREHFPSYYSNIDSSAVVHPVKSNANFILPVADFFEKNSLSVDSNQQEVANQQIIILEKKLERFGIQGKVVAIHNGPVVTLFEYEPHMDTKLSKIIALEDDLALALQALSIRILAPIPGKSVVGFEVARLSRIPVLFGEIIRAAIFKNTQARLPIILGKDTIGQDVIIDLAAMPHLLVAGSTGSGKSVALNCMLISLLCKMSPQQLNLILIDPKRLEFAAYADIAHLLFPIVSDPRKAGPVLRWVVQEMERRYELMAAHGVRNIHDYQRSTHQEQLSYIVVVIDELADLMMTAGKETEDLITRIAQMARASGIHLIVATQRPSVDVITGLIKVNFPSRISFRVTSKIDSRTILDSIGADKLLGRGDMLFLDAHAAGLKRVHGAYMSDLEINKVVQHIRNQQPVKYKELQLNYTDISMDIDQEDERLLDQIYSYLDEAETTDISISLLQRKFRIGYNKSARIVSLLEQRGKVMPAQSGKTRKVVK